MLKRHRRPYVDPKTSVITIRKRSCRKIMFLHLSVILFKEGEEVYTPPDTFPGRHPLGRHPHRQTPPGRHPLGRHPPWQTLPPGDSHCSRLECILVSNPLCHLFTTSICRNHIEDDVLFPNFVRFSKFYYFIFTLNNIYL